MVLVAFLSTKNVANATYNERIEIMRQQVLRDTLIHNTISAIAGEGLDKTTTRAIIAESGINEAYIYRLFGDKEGLLASAFDALDNELVLVTTQNLSVMHAQEMDIETRCRLYFFAVWRFMLSNREKCLAFVRYYYSPYFAKNSMDDHKVRYMLLMEQISTAFRAEADVWMILNHILNVMLDFAVKVHNGQMPGNDDYAEHVFRVIYVSVKQYFRTNEEGGSCNEESAQYY